MTDENKQAEQPEKPIRRRRGKRLVITALVLVAAAVAVFSYWYYFMRGYVSTDDASIDSDAVTVSSKLLGRIRTLTAAEGDTVAAGELLVQLDDSDLEARKAEAEADLEYVRQEVRLATVALERAHEDFDRDSIQFAAHAITREQFTHTRNALEMARARRASSVSHVKAAEAKLTVIETQLKNARITAPCSGVVARKWVVRGDVAQPGQPIYTLFDLTDIWITANFEETKLSSIHPGNDVRISVDAYPDETYTGRVELIGAAAASKFSLIPPNNTSGNFTKVTQRIPIKIVFDSTRYAGAHRSLLPGMSVEVKVRSGAPQE